jgi:hypothetical protein
MDLRQQLMKELERQPAGGSFKDVLGLEAVGGGCALAKSLSLNPEDGVEAATLSC